MKEDFVLLTDTYEGWRRGEDGRLRCLKCGQVLEEGIPSPFGKALKLHKKGECTP